MVKEYHPNLLVDITNKKVSGKEVSGYIEDNDKVDFYIKIMADTIKEGKYPVAIDLFNFGQIGDGVSPKDRLNNAIYRLELEERAATTPASSRAPWSSSC